MVETITPVVHGGRRGRWVANLLLHALGAGGSAALLGAVLGWAGLLAGGPWAAGAWVVIVAALLYLGREAGLRVPVPQMRRQVPESWRRIFPSSLSSFLYGVVLGTGFPTHLGHGTLVVVALAAFVSASPALGALVLVPFGLVRGLSILVVGAASGPDDVGAVIDRLESAAGRPTHRLLHVVALAAVGGAVLAAGPAAPRLDVGAAAATTIAVVFGWAALAKVAAPRTWREALTAYDLPRPIAAAARWAVPVVEAAVAVLAVAGAARVAGSAAAALLVVFSLGILRARSRRGGGRLPCGCFGRRRSRRYGTLLARNGLLLAAAVAAAVWPPGASILAGVAPPGAGDGLAVALVVAGLALAVLLLRGLGTLNRRPTGSST